MPQYGLYRNIPEKDYITAEVTEAEIQSLTWLLSHVCQGRAELTRQARYRMSNKLNDEQRARVLKNAMAQIAQASMNPRANDPNYPLD